MEELLLIEPTMKYAEKIMAYRDEFLKSGDSMDGTGALRRFENAAEYIKHCADMKKEETVPSGLVPATQFLFVRKSDDKIVGMLQVRHYFNEELRNFGGTIGYSVCPSERRKGYAKAMLKAALPYCKSIGLEKVLVTCVDGNIGSEKTILANGGVYENTVFYPKESVFLKRFWIKL